MVTEMKSLNSNPVFWRLQRPRDFKTEACPPGKWRILNRQYSLTNPAPPVSPKDHTNIRILCSGPKQDEGGCQKPWSMEDPYVYVVIWAPSVLSLELDAEASHGWKPDLVKSQHRPGAQPGIPGGQGKVSSYGFKCKPDLTTYQMSSLGLTTYQQRASTLESLGAQKAT